MTDNPTSRLLACGGRTYSNAVMVYRTLDALHAQHRFTDFIQGGAAGADALARDWAITHPEITRWECKATWRDLSHPDAVIKVRASDGVRYDAKAGIRRNTRMLEWKPDIVVSFPGGDGTADMVAQARAAGVEVMEVE